MNGIISCVKHSEAQGNLYFIAEFEKGFRCAELRHSMNLSAGDFLNSDSGLIMEPEQSHRYKKQMYLALEEKISKTLIKKKYMKKVDGLDKVTSMLWDRLEAASALFLRKLLLGAPIVVRFHNDADGSGGAYCLYQGIKDLAGRVEFSPNIVWIMNRGVSYSRMDAENDILITNNYSSIEKPLLMIIDFGTSIESNSGIDAIKGKFDVIWLDHHPLASGFTGVSLEHYINPWNFGGDSNYTAGFLASAFSKTFSKVDTSEYENASFIGDYSEYADAEGKGADASTIFDLVTSDLSIALGPNKTNVTPQEFEAIFGNKEKYSELLAYANIRLNEVLDGGMKYMKKYNAKDFDIFLLDFEDVRSEDSKYPLPGRFASKLLGRINVSGSKRAMVIVHVGAYLLMRLDKGLCNDLSLLDIIEDMKTKYGDSIEGGGGHRCAGAIKLRDKSNKKSMINEIIKSLK
jgi:RecJ-like exonuclease